MTQPGFWDNPEKAQEVIQQLKPINALLKPFDEVTASIGDVEALAELTAEDSGLEGELSGELDVPPGVCGTTSTAVARLGLSNGTRRTLPRGAFFLDRR